MVGGLRPVFREFPKLLSDNRSVSRGDGILAGGWLHRPDDATFHHRFPGVPERSKHQLMRQRCGRFGFNISKEAIRALFRVMNRYVGNLPPMPGVFPHQK
jgi:hypothetical protein